MVDSAFSFCLSWVRICFLHGLLRILRSDFGKTCFLQISLKHVHSAGRGEATSISVLGIALSPAIGFRTFEAQARALSSFVHAFTDARVRQIKFNKG